MAVPNEAWASTATAAAHLVLEATGDPLEDDVVVDGDDGHHLQRVRRLEVGEVVTIADGAGSWRPYDVCEVTKGRLRLTATGPSAVEPRLAPPLTVACSLTKGAKPEKTVARLTELGVDRVLVVVSRRSVARWGADGSAALARLRRVGREAAMQCRRARIPVIEGPESVAGLVGRPGLVVADPGGGSVGELAVPGSEGWLLAIGPEGGFAPEELEAFGSAPRIAVGPFVLRAETAATAVAAALATRRRPQDCHAA